MNKSNEKIDATKKNAALTIMQRELRAMDENTKKIKRAMDQVVHLKKARNKLWKKVNAAIEPFGIIVGDEDGAYSITVDGNSV